MIGLGAIVKSFIKVLDQAAEGLRMTLRNRRAKPRLIPIPINSKPRRG